MFLMLDPGQTGGQQSMSVFLLEIKPYHQKKIPEGLEKDNAVYILFCDYQQIP